MSPCNTFRQAIGACAIDPDTRDPGQAIFSKQRLAIRCTREVIFAVLSCSCTRCHEHSHYTYTTLPANTAANHIIGDSNQPPLILTFCLLVSIGCPRFIYCCLRQQHLINDDSIGNRTDGFSLEDVHQNIWGEYASKDHAESLRLARLFWWNRRQFFVPIIDTKPFDVYDRSTLLPFIDEKPLYARREDGEEVQDHGAFGRVFSFRIVPEYNQLPPNGTGDFVRKELFNSSEARFHAERQNLEIVKRLEDPHIVRLLKSYRHGDTFNFIFHRAKTNLGFFLRNERFNASPLRTIPIESSPLWTQALGLAKALSNVINYKPPDDGQPGPLLYGYHFDLKPANVLVEHDDTFLISDFGQARFQLVGDTSRITPVGGTYAYAPPEIDTEADRFNRKYDVWSLGCMFLEICTFVTKSHAGVRELDDVRETRRGNVRNDCFFIRIGTNIHAIKPEVLQWMESLCHSEEVQTWNSREFLQEIIELIKHMLEPVILHRLSAQDVCQTLEGILRRYQPSATTDPTGIIPQLTPEREDLEYAPDLTWSIRSMLYFSEGLWLPSRIKFVEDCNIDVSILVTKETFKNRLKLGPRSSLKMVARYASHSRLQEGLPGCHIYFVNTRRGVADEIVPTTRLYFQDPSECVLAASAFIGQNIQSSLPVQTCNISRHVPLIRRLSRHDSVSDSGSPTCIEMWCENSNRHSPILSRSRSRQSVRQNVFSEPDPRRIVLYFERNILIIRFAKNVRVKHQAPGDNSLSVTFVPTEPSRDRTFTASLLKPKRGEGVAGIPISFTHLENEEEEHKFECKSVEVVFKNESERHTFFHTYRRMKEEWRNEDRQLEPYRRNMGQILGYAPN